MNYSQLSAAIQSYIENTFPQTYLYDNSTVSSQTQINTFIKQAEQRIYNFAQPPALRKNVNGSFTSGNKYLNLPPDFLSVYSVAVYTDPVLLLESPQEFLIDKDVNFIRQAYPTPTDAGVPKYYALFGVTQGVNVTLLSCIISITHRLLLMRKHHGLGIISTVFFCMALYWKPSLSSKVNQM
jgi:hypothetical protein